ncbi:helix-turn-helix domain-containing protein [Paenibacillus mesophilus]|uniref:AraC family transcriptional regulator n=1 Tax=Paenibacillus mesophilus TaxID=2582849 RepID=UPI00110EC899|nr:AraC family transcriptional regulator [Paenibacillus mesophilus]TMV43729.1 helix-turn-helix domain-containing protein [Paenibacillus mesophilus]
MLAQIDFMFRRSRTARTYMRLHQHRCCEIVYYASGEGLTRVDGTEYRYGTNTYAVIPPSTPHDEYRDEDTEVLCIGFSLTGRDVPSLQQGLFRDSPSSPILGMLLDIMAEMQEKDAYYDQLLKLRISEIVIEHLRAVASSETVSADDHLHYTRTYMDENFNQKISVKELAALSGYSYHHFRHMFKTQFGLSPIQYLIGKRLEHARSLLRYTDLPITSITTECGFSNDAQFCTIFKRELRETPLSFRQNRYSNTLYSSS